MGAGSRPHKVWAGAGAMVECKQEGSGPNPRTAKERKKKKQQDSVDAQPTYRTGVWPRTKDK